MKRTIRQPRGQAAVELAVTMIVIVPTVFYAMFLADLLAYRLDQSEAIYSTSWDYITFDYQGKGAPPESKVGGGGQPTTGQTTTVDHYARLTFCDHWSHYATYSQDDCDSDTHHRNSGVNAEGVNLAGHQCWIAQGGARQVKCDISQDSYFGNSVGLLSMGRWNSNFNGGGVFSCHGRLAVMNYFMPNKFFEWFAKSDVTNRERFTGKVHSDKDSTTSANTIMLKEDKFGVLHDPWAVNWPESIDGDTDVGFRAPYDSIKDDNPFYERMKVHYDPVGLGFGGLAMSQLGLKLAQKKLINYTALNDYYFGDNPMTPTLAFKPSDNTRTVNGFYGSAWADSRQQSSYNGRKDQYFGWQNASKW